jgi:GntR family transcriptional regulator
MAVMQFHLNQNSGVSYYLQLIKQVQQGLQFGILQAGDRLPTVKEVAAQTAVNPNTVLRAYRELEHDGLVVSRTGLGTFVATQVPPALAAASYRALRADLERWIRKARLHGVDDQRLAALFEHVLHENADEGAA